MLNALLVSVLIAASIISRAYGDDTDDKIRRLEARITQLEQRLAALEEKATTDRTVKQSSSSAEGWRDKQTWRQLKIGMTKHEVQAILGEPGRISASDLGDHWYYPDPLGGSARFSKEERLNSWSEP
jgi:hypothetical protein